jgi:hypothetical protein
VIFLQPDGKQVVVGDYNFYCYCHNAPVNKSDPFGLRFFDLGSSDQFFVAGGDDHGLTQPEFKFDMVLDRTASGFRLAEVRQVNMYVKSVVATHGKEGQHSYLRSPEDHSRTVKHEGLHREHNANWYNKNEKGLLKAVNGANGTVYKDTKEAEKALGKLVGKYKPYQQFKEGENAHTGPNWPNYVPGKDERR